MLEFKLIIVAIIIGITLFALKLAKARKQLSFIESYRFHDAIRKKIEAKHPTLSKTEVNLVFTALRDYFYTCNKAGKNMVAMPSQVVDDAWHEFILFTKAYDDFCKKAFGRFLHHTPAEAMRRPTSAQEGIKLAWKIACFKEGIDAKKPIKLPLIFAIDKRLNIPNGFFYALDCSKQSSSNNNSTAPSGDYCATHIGCSSSGCSSDNSSSGCGSSCSSGCGGGD